MKKNKGVLTVEAALMIPIFVFSILFMTNFMKIVYVYDTVQTNIYNTAKFINAYTYIPEDATDATNEVLQRVQSIFTNVTNNKVDESDVDKSDNDENTNEATSLVLKFINLTLKNGFQSAKNGVINGVAQEMCKKLLEDEIGDGKRKWLGINKEFDFSGTEFHDNEIKLVVKYTVKVKAPFINIDRDINLRNQVVISKLGN